MNDKIISSNGLIPMSESQKKQMIKNDILLEMLGINSPITVMRNYYMTQSNSTESRLLKEMVKEGLVKQSKTDPTEILLFKATRKGEKLAQELKLLPNPSQTEE